MQVSEVSKKFSSFFFIYKFKFFTYFLFNTIQYSFCLYDIHYNVHSHTAALKILSWSVWVMKEKVLFSYACDAFIACDFLHGFFYITKFFLHKKFKHNVWLLKIWCAEQTKNVWSYILINHANGFCLQDYFKSFNRISNLCSKLIYEKKHLFFD